MVLAASLHFFLDYPPSLTDDRLHVSYIISNDHSSSINVAKNLKV